jgi:single-stranded DNA-binding protein
MPTNNTNRPSNYFIVTARAFRKEGEDGGVQLTKNGQPIAKCRASVSMGKDRDTNEYKPSMWIELVGYTAKGDDANAVTEAVGELQTGEYVTVKGRLAMEEWTGDDGVTRQSFTLWVNAIEPFSFDNDAQDEEEGDEEDLI